MSNRKLRQDLNRLKAEVDDLRREIRSRPLPTTVPLPYTGPTFWGGDPRPIPCTVPEVYPHCPVTCGNSSGPFAGTVKLNTVTPADLSNLW